MAQVFDNWEFLLNNIAQEENESIRDFVTRMLILRDIAEAKGRFFTDKEFATLIVQRVLPRNRGVAMNVLYQTSTVHTNGTHIILYGIFLDKLCRTIEIYNACIQSGINHYKAAQDAEVARESWVNYYDSLQQEMQTVGTFITDMDNQINYMYTTSEIYFDQGDQLAIPWFHDPDLGVESEGENVLPDMNL